MRLDAPGAKNSRHATVCETYEVPLYALGSRTVYVIIFFPTENTSEIFVMEPEDDTNERQCLSKCQ